MVVWVKRIGLVSPTAAYVRAFAGVASNTLQITMAQHLVVLPYHEQTVFIPPFNECWFMIRHLSRAHMIPARLVPKGANQTCLESRFCYEEFKHDLIFFMIDCFKPMPTACL